MYEDSSVEDVLGTFMFITTEQGFAAGPYAPAEAASMAQDYEDRCRDAGLPIDDVHLVTFAEVVKAGLAAHVAGIAPVLAAATMDTRSIPMTDPEA